MPPRPWDSKIKNEHINVCESQEALQVLHCSGYGPFINHCHLGWVHVNAVLPNDVAYEGDSDDVELTFRPLDIQLIFQEAG